MRPGRARLVNTPASNTESELLREVAKSMGIEMDARARGYQLRETIDYVLEHAGLMVAFDEFQFAIPASYSRNTTAMGCVLRVDLRCWRSEWALFALSFIRDDYGGRREGKWLTAARSGG